MTALLYTRVKVKRSFLGKPIHAIGLGCMGLSHAYGPPPAADAAGQLLRHAVDLGVQHFDTAALYGLGRNEKLLGESLKAVRDQVIIASKAGVRYVGETRIIDGRPDTLRRTCEDALQRLRTDHIDLYYLHRVDPAVPVEESVGALGDLVRAGKIGAVGLSEVSAATLLRAHRVVPIAAVQSEYSLWTRNPEMAVLNACRDIGAAFVAFSPLGRGFLAGGIGGDGFKPGDIRARMPRFQAPNLTYNLAQFAAFAALARDAHVSPAQLALAWLLSRGDHIHAIPGTTRIAHLEQNHFTPSSVAPQVLAQAGVLINHGTIWGDRYPASADAETTS